jgi:hypothetical protein
MANSILKGKGEKVFDEASRQWSNRSAAGPSVPLVYAARQLAPDLPFRLMKRQVNSYLDNIHHIGQH